MEFHTNKIDNEDKPLKGLQDKGMVHFSCADCGKELLVLQLTTVKTDKCSDVGDHILTRVAVKCRDCGGFSYSQQIPGQFHPGAPSDDMAFDIRENDDDGDAPEHEVLFEAWSK